MADWLEIALGPGFGSGGNFNPLLACAAFPPVRVKAAWRDGLSAITPMKQGTITGNTFGLIFQDMVGSHCLAIITVVEC
jgi:hypothetical protein